MAMYAAPEKLRALQGLMARLTTDDGYCELLLNLKEANTMLQDLRACVIKANYPTGSSGICKAASRTYDARPAHVAAHASLLEALVECDGLRWHIAQQNDVLASRQASFWTWGLQQQMCNNPHYSIQGLYAFLKPMTNAVVNGLIPECEKGRLRNVINLVRDAVTHMLRAMLPPGPEKEEDFNFLLDRELLCDDIDERAHILQSYHKVTEGNPNTFASHNAMFQRTRPNGRRPPKHSGQYNSGSWKAAAASVIDCKSP